MKDRYKDLVAGLIVILFAGLIYISTFGMKSLVHIQIEPTTIPRLTALVLFLIGVGIMIKWLWMRHKGVLPLDEERKEDKPGTIIRFTPLITFILIFIYILLLKRIGFTLSTILFLTAEITLLSANFTRKNILKNLAISVAAAVVIFLIFYVGFQRAIPVGPWGF